MLSILASPRLDVSSNERALCFLGILQESSRAFPVLRRQLLILRLPLQHIKTSDPLAFVDKIRPENPQVCLLSFARDVCVHACV